MSLAVVGLSHHTAPVEVRERFVFDASHAEAALRRLVSQGIAEEAVLLSTCNRTEVYLVLPSGTDKAAGREKDAGASGWVVEVMATVLGVDAGVSPDELVDYLYVHRGRAAATHLFRVASSLDSMILGEAQIQGQVKEAYELAAGAEGGGRVVGPVLSRLFQTALSVGGQVRAETVLGAGAASIPSAAVELAKKIFGSLDGRRALVLGAGEMSELALECFAAEGVRNMVVANRTESRAREVASRRGAEAVGMDGLAERLVDAEIVATATAAPRPVLTRELVDRVLPDGAPHPLLIVDIALPRDVEPEVGEVENVFLYDIDDLQQIVDGNLERRRKEIPAAEQIIADAVDDFWKWYAARDVVPLIRELRSRAEAVRQTEVEKALRKLKHLGPEERDAVETLTRQLLNKVLHRPTVRLREAASNGRGPNVADAARYLFALDTSREAGEE